MKPLIRIGTRASQLAMAQSGQVQKELAKKNPGSRFLLVPIKSEGDRDRSFGLFKKGEVGVFTKELEKKLLSAEIDIAVHSLKDLPTSLLPELVIGAYPKRSSIRDVLVSAKKWDLKTLPLGASVGTGSPRRKRQLLALRPDLKLIDMRGNLDTRVQKAIQRKGVDAVLVAEAGLLRIGKYIRYAKPLNPDRFLPAVGQGALALEVRKEDAKTQILVEKLDHGPTRIAVTAERAFLKALRGGCRVPVGVHVKLASGRIRMTSAVYSVRENLSVLAQATSTFEGREKMAKNLAKRLLDQGARNFLREARS